METPVSQRHHRLLTCLSCLPQKIVSVHGIDNVTEFVLHDLCVEPCFNLTKAAYFIDNPDFDCLKGVTGFAQEERYPDFENTWNNPEKFTEHMKAAAFNQKVRSLNHCSLKHSGTTEEAMVQDVAQQLGIANPSLFTWDMKHGNRGVLIFQRPPQDPEPTDEQLLRGLYLLAFCPVY